MLKCFTTSSSEKIIPITPVITNEFAAWLPKQNERTKKWLQTTLFIAKPGTFCFIMDAKGNLEQVILAINNIDDFWSFANLPRLLPEGIYFIDTNWKDDVLERACLGWGFGAYQFTPYKKQPEITAKLQLPKNCDATLIENYVRSIFMVKDLINTPTEDMGPAELAEAAFVLAKEFGAKAKQIVGDDLLTQGFPLIHAVGRASSHEPRLIDLRWGKTTHPKVTLIGKGVCFDTGGLDLKPTDGMLLMKKDMGGAAHVLGIARMIMATQLPIQLRVLIPAVENSVSGDAYRPGDILVSRKGISVEITNTDAEGRLVLADALAEATTDKPELIIDFATLTGAAAIALGPEIPALLTAHEELAKNLIESANQVKDPIWRLPLYQPYRRYLESQIADIANASLNRYGGVITAALFLQEFVPAEIPWAHFDLMAWNPDIRNGGRILGAEAMALRAVFNYLQRKFM